MLDRRARRSNFGSSNDSSLTWTPARVFAKLTYVYTYRSRAVEIMGKRPRNGPPLTDLGRSSHVSMRGIEALLKAVREQGIPEVSSARSQYRARKQFAATPTPYGRLIAEDVLLTAKGEYRIGVQQPMPIIHHC